MNIHFFKFQPPLTLIRFFNSKAFLTFNLSDNASLSIILTI